MQNYNGKIKRIYTKKLALKLRLKGFDIIGTEPNYKKPQFDVYLFKETEELNKALTELTKETQGRKNSQGKKVNSGSKATRATLSGMSEANGTEMSGRVD